MKKRTITLEGVLYPSILAACKATGKIPSTISRNLNKGLSDHAAFGLPEPVVEVEKKPRRHRKPRQNAIPVETVVVNEQKASIESAAVSTPRKNTKKPVECHGVTYDSVGAFARAFNLNASTVRGALLKGVSPESLVPSTQKTPGVSVDECYIVGYLKFDSLSELSEAFSISVEVIQSRLDAAWSVAQAVGAIPPPLDTVLKKPSSTKRKRTRGPSVPVSHAEQDQGLAQQSVSTRVRNRKPDQPAGGATGPSKRNQVMYKGESYRSLRALAAAKGISPHTLRYQAVTLGKGVDEAMQQLTQKGHNQSSNGNAHPITFRSKKYASVRVLADEFGVDPSVVNRRLKNGWSKEEALGLVGKDVETGEDVNAPVSLEYKGKTFRSVRALAERYNVSASKVRYRLKKGWTVAQAIGHSKPPARHGKPVKGFAKAGAETKQSFCDVSSLLPIKIGKLVFTTATAMAKHYGKNPAKVIGRLRNYWTPEEALELVPHLGVLQPKVKVLTLKGKRYHSASELAAAFSVSPRVVQYRLSQGATPAQAVGLKPWSGKPAAEVVNYDGVEYASHRELCQKLKLNYRVVMAKIHQGETLAAAVTSEAARLKTTSVDKKMLASKEKRRLAESIAKQMAEPVSLGNIKFSSTQDFAEHLNLDPMVVYRRMVLEHWTPEQVAGLSSPPNWQK